MPVTTRRMKRINAPTLTSLPTELLDEIFDLAYAEDPPKGPICRKLLASHRRQIVSLTLPAKVNSKHLDALLPCLIRLRTLTLAKAANPHDVLSRLPAPLALRKLAFVGCTLPAEKSSVQNQDVVGSQSGREPGPEHGVDAAVEPPTEESNTPDFFRALARFTLLETFHLLSDCNSEQATPLFAVFAQLPLKHLALGPTVKIEAKQLALLLGSRLSKFRHVLDDEYDSDGEPYPRNDEDDEDDEDDVDDEEKAMENSTSAASSNLSRTLERLTLDFFDGEEGGRGHKYSRWPDFLASWDLPRWRDGFNYEDLLAIFSIAKAENIKVDGRAVYAAGVEGDFKGEKEVFWAEKEDDRDEYGGYGGGYSYGRYDRYYR
ncbi:hypothetical protein JCM8097_004778 [Rhodosporidiobolus ruineniae]